MNFFLLLLRSFLERRLYLFTQLASFAVALHLSRRRTNTRTGTPLCGYAYALCQTKIVQQGRGEGAKCNACSAIWNATIIRSVVRRGMPDVRNAQVPLESSSSAAAATSTPSSSVPHLLPSSLPPSLLPSPLSFHYFAQISSYIKKKELGLPYTAHIRIYMTGSICLLQLTAA